MNTMKTSLPPWVFKSIAVALALSGWALWAHNRHVAQEMSQVSRELEELNEFLLQDIGQFKHKYERLVKAGAFSGRGVSDFRLRQAIAALREENGALQKKLDELSKTHKIEL